jgi:hypothetical protein
MNDIDLNLGTIATSNFSGPAAAAATSSGTSGITNLSITGSTGTYGGTFNGTNANEVAGTFQLTGGASTASVIGSFGAKR